MKLERVRSCSSKQFSAILMTQQFLYILGLTSTNSKAIFCICEFHWNTINLQVCRFTHDTETQKLTSHISYLINFLIDKFPG